MVDPSRILRPERPQLARALAAVTEPSPGYWARNGVSRLLPSGAEGGGLFVRWTVASPQEAWEALAVRGVIPMEWVGDERRAFVCAECAGGGLVLAEWADPADEREGDLVDCARCDGAGRLPHPPTVAACVAVASDPRGVATAEEIARAMATKRTRVGEPHRGRLERVPERVVWHVSAAAEWPEVERRARLRARTAWPLPWWRDLLATGYVVDRIDEDAIALMCPEL